MTDQQLFEHQAVETPLGPARPMSYRPGRSRPEQLEQIPLRCRAALGGWNTANHPKRTFMASGFGILFSDKRENNGRPFRTARIPLQFGYCPAWFLITSSTWAFTASRLKLAGACIGGKSMAVFTSSPTACCTETKRQNSRA